MPRRVPRIDRKVAPPADLTAPYTLALTTGRGQLWRADALVLLRAQPTQSVNLVVADPPYAIGKAAWDCFASEAAYVAWCDDWLAEVARVLVPSGSAYVCGFSETLAEIKARSAQRFASCRWLVWTYRNKANLGNDWGRSHESILHLRMATANRINVDAVRVPYNAHTTRYPARTQAVNSQYGDGGNEWRPHPLGAKPRDVFELPILCNGMAEKSAHPTQKPEALIEKLVLASSAPNDLVLDPFAGSGTTAAVAERLGRRWLAGDADAGYVAIARARIVAGGAAVDPLSEARQARTVKQRKRATSA